MANEEHITLLKQSVADWNTWRRQSPDIRPDLSTANLSRAKLRGADLSRTDLSGANLSRADLSEANLRGADLSGANLRGANLFEADLSRTDLSGANLREADLSRAKLSEADLSESDLSEAALLQAFLVEANLREADLSEAYLCGAYLSESDLSRADLSRADLSGAHLSKAVLSGANLSRAVLSGANLSEADLSESDLSGANLVKAHLVGTNLTNANLTGCRIYGVSAWDLKLEGAIQQNLVITSITSGFAADSDITVDNIEVAQFIYLLFHNEKIRDVIDTIGRKGVLLLGRFTEGRIEVLKQLREALRTRGYLPIVFNFDKPATKDFTETVRLLAGLSKFVIADITNPKSTPLELQATVPDMMIPFQPIIEKGEKPFAMLNDLWIKYRDWVFEPIYYSSVEALVTSLDKEIIGPAETRFAELLARKAERMSAGRII